MCLSRCFMNLTTSGDLKAWTIIESLPSAVIPLLAERWSRLRYSLMISVLPTGPYVRVTKGNK